MPLTPLTPTFPQGQEIKNDAPGGPSKALVAKQQMDVEILKASATVSLSSGNDSQALLFRSAIERINEMLAPELGDNAIQNAAAEDNSAEATAGRILSLSTGFFEAYAAQRQGDDPAQVAQDFVDLIRGGFEEGFAEARDILEGMGVLGEEVEGDIMKTFDLVQKGYDDFLAAKLAAPAPDPQTASTS
jgi:hypothetical protein